MKTENYRNRLATRETKWLKAKAIEVFNAFIRERDKDEPCISCGNFRELEAGHFYSAGHHQSLRFLELNVNGQCNRCNWYLRGNLINYRKGLIEKYGEKKVKWLEISAGLEKNTGHHKITRLSLIEIIIKYKS